MNMQKTLRWATEDDFDQLGEVMFDAIRNGPSLYSEEQRIAWLPAPFSGTEWIEKLAGQSIILEDMSGHVTGFMSLAPKGYINLVFIRPSAQGTGLFRRLYENIETKARADGVQVLSVHASLMARPAFAAMGFTVTTEETAERNNQMLRRFAMEKSLVD